MMVHASDLFFPLTKNQDLAYQFGEESVSCALNNALTFLLLFYRGRVCILHLLTCNFVVAHLRFVLC